MKARFYLINIIASLLISFTGSTQSDLRFSEPSLTSAYSPDKPKVVSDNWFTNASTWIKQFEYGFHNDGYDAYRTVNSASRVAYRISKEGYSAYPMRLEESDQDWEVHFGLHSIGRNEAVAFFKQMVSAEQADNVLKQHFGFADVEYRNDEKGLRQNFIVYRQPGGDGDLKLKLSLQSKLQAKLINGQSLVFESRPDGKKRLIYEDLKVWDARHLSVNAHMELDKKGRELSLVIDDKDAVYPITIDPISKSPDWTSSADGLLPGLLTNLQLQVQTLYGYTVTGLGDINGDTYDDVAVSAPTMANVVSGSGALLGVGAVFVYLGSSGGLPAQPNHVLQPSVLVGGGLFGLSVSAGDVVGTAAPDIIVGAPLESVTLNFGILGGVVTGKVGQVHIYDGANVTGPLNPSATLTVTLSTGELTASTITLNSLLGFSVAATGDMNGDGKGEVIAGAPTFARLSGAVNVKTGGAFVFLSGGFTVIRSLDPPTGSVLGLSGAVQTIIEALPGGPGLWSVASILLTPLLNGQIEGLLFGYSVENAGPYTSDGISDVIVGAPAGVNLGDLSSGLSLASAVSNALSGQVLGGSAYVFAGNGVTLTGVATTPVARLQASPTGLLSNTANLFGFSIRGVEGLTGVKNGNVLVSAPVSAVLSNVLGGLQLKSGSVNVFAKQTGAITNPVAPLQTITSPRAASVLGLLTGQVLNTSLLYGASMDNLMDINCDGFADIIVGEPTSTSIPLIGANVIGGAAYVMLGRPNGTYTPYHVWELTTTASPLVGLNATALLGWSVAGAGHTWGPLQPVRSVVGGPANSLDFGVGLLNLGNTVGTLVGFVADANGIGKAYSFNADLCGIVTLPATLISFKGDKTDNGVGLEWIAVDEKDLSHYEVERSTNGREFTTLDKVTAKDLQRVTYNWPDMRPVYGNNYYRLKIVDDNGKFSYSNTIVVQFNQKSQGVMAVIPNPAIQQLSVRLTGYEKGEYTLRLYNTAGILFETRKVNLREHQQTEVMNRSRSIVPGVYMITLHDENNNKLGTTRVIFNGQ